MTDNATKFLVVEDNDLDVEKITRGFSRMNISNEVIRAVDGYDALDILRGSNGKTKIQAPYLIFLDLNMPKMNGLEFLEALRADNSISHSPVVVMTTSGRREDVEKAYAHNICGYVVKPAKIDQMFEALGTLNMYWSLCEMPHGNATA